jgi:transcriptional regulator with XRE-family HTH domain
LERAFDDENRRRELAEFLKSRRRRLMPTTAGLHAGRRRLTSGLRREEVAELAGVGITWYTWLEQARDIRPSEITLLRIARALQLNAVEKRYLLDVALEHGQRIDRDEVATPLLLSVINGLDSPAIVMGRWWDRVACNAAANALFDYDYAPSCNRLDNLFTPQICELYPNWAQLARQVVGQFRAHTASMLAHPAVVRLVAELKQRSDDFRAWWDEQEVCDVGNSGHVTYCHPFAGRLSFDYTFLQVLESPTLTLQIQVCDGAESRARLDELLRQQLNGERSATHNLWAALAPRPQPSARNNGVRYACGGR